MAMRTLAFEIGTEEHPRLRPSRRRPPQDGRRRARGVRRRGHSVGDVEVYSTPRRLAVVADGVPGAPEKIEEVFRGPAAKIAFDADGNPTKAALGFARGKGVDASALERRDENGVEYVYAVKQTPRARCGRAFAGHPRGVITAIQWPKAQRWGSAPSSSAARFAGCSRCSATRSSPVEFAGLVAGDETRGHRFLSPGPHKVPDADSYVDVLRGRLRRSQRGGARGGIREQGQAEQKVGLVAELPAKIMEEVVNLAEYPTVMVGTFDELFLAVPQGDHRRRHARPPALLPAVQRGRLAGQQVPHHLQRRSLLRIEHRRRQRARRRGAPVRRQVLLRRGPQAPARGLRRAT